MDIDFDLYKVFVSVASNGSFSKASEELGVTQSAVSQSISKLETIFEKELFIRNKQGVKLTGFGSELYEQVSLGVKQLNQVYEKAISLKKHDKTIKVGASGTIAVNLLIPIIKKHFTGIHFYIESLMSDKEKIIAVENGTLDFAIINDYNLPLSSNLYKKRLLSLDYGFFYNDKLLNVTEENLYNQTLILKNAGTKGRVEFNKKYYGLAYKFVNLMEYSHDDIIIEATKAGLGIGFCPKQYVDGLAKVNIDGETITKNIVLIYQQKSEVIDLIINNF